MLDYHRIAEWGLALAMKSKWGRLQTKWPLGFNAEDLAWYRDKLTQVIPFIQPLVPNGLVPVVLLESEDLGPVFAPPEDLEPVEA